MSEYINKLRLRFITNKEHHQYRQEKKDPYLLAREFSQEQLGDVERAVRRLEYMLGEERPVVFPDEKIAFLRTVPVVQEIYTPEEWAALRERYYIHEQGKVCNITPEYDILMQSGTEAKLRELRAQRSALPESETEKREYAGALIRSLEAVQNLADRYREEAIRVGNSTVAATLERVPRHKPEGFLEALQCLRILHYCLWTSFNYHNTFGRFDQYMLPYLQKSLDEGMSMDQAQELLEEFFLSCNKDSDLYTGMQQGDNGQSIVLGGTDPQGRDAFNTLSEMCLTACENLRLIDPKINLRVNRNTPLSLYERGTRLTKLGLGFPQYSNDDVVVPCLKHWGYDEQDAYNYTIAACWEFIIPGVGMDIPNINGMSFTRALLDCLPELERQHSFEETLQTVRSNIFSQVHQMVKEIGEVYMEPAPLMSLMMRGCAQNLRDISLGSKYNNYGFHGTGLATAVDSLAAIKKYVFEEKRFSARQLNEMLRADFAGYEQELHTLRFEAPKMGNDDDQVDSIATALLDCFADAVQGCRNSRGGIYRAGTGSAMYYIWHSKEEQATPDGRRAGEGLACNYSPSLFARCKGPISIIKSFAKPHLERVANGGPLTIELHDSIFRNEESIRKVAMFVKSFMDLGGHQMQINAVNRDVLKDAKLHPENYSNLIVRVWGWSGYFVELDEVYQDHIIERMELAM